LFNFLSRIFKKIIPHVWFNNIDASIGIAEKSSPLNRGRPTDIPRFILLEEDLSGNKFKDSLFPKLEGEDG